MARLSMTLTCPLCDWVAPLFTRERGAKARKDANGNTIPPKSKPTFGWLRKHMDEDHPGEWEWHVQPHAASVAQSTIDGVHVPLGDEPEVVEDEWTRPTERMIAFATREEDAEVPLDMLLFLK